MKLAGLAVSMGLGIAAGAVAVMMLPRHCAVRRAMQKAADTVEDAAMSIGDTIADKMDM